MSRSKIISSVLVAGGLLVSSALVSPAAAQKGMVLSPSTNWAVSKVDGDTPGTGYCALARRYNQNTILTFAQNRISELSFALDFQRPRFETTESIDIILDAGAGEQRDFVITPASNKAFVVRLGRDDTFFEALNATGYLRAEVDGYLYGFNLADIDDGRKELADCVQNSLPPINITSQATSGISSPKVNKTNAAAEKLISSTPEGASQSISDIKSDLEKENRRLRMELQGKDIENIGEVNNLRNEIVKLQEQNEHLRKKVDGLQLNNSNELTSAIEKMHESADTVDEFEAQNESLKTKIQANELERDRLTADLMAAEQKNQSLRGELQTLEAGYMQQIETIRAELNQQQKINEDLRLSLDEGNYASAEQLKVVKAELLQAQDLLREYEKRAGEMEARLEAKATEHESMLENVAALENENQKLRSGVTESNSKQQEELVSLRREVKALVGENETLTMIIKAQEKDDGKAIDLAASARKTLEDSLDKLKQEHEETAAKLRAVQDENVQLSAQLNNQVQNTGQREAELMAALEMAKLKNKELQEGLAKTSVSQSTEAENLKTKLSSMQQEMQAMEKNYAAQVNNLKGQLAARNADLSEQKASVVQKTVSKAAPVKDIAQQAPNEVSVAQALPVPKNVRSSATVNSEAKALEQAERMALKKNTENVKQEIQKIEEKTENKSDDILVSTLSDMKAEKRSSKDVSTLPSSPNTVDLMKSANTSSVVPQLSEISSEDLLEIESTSSNKSEKIVAAKSDVYTRSEVQAFTEAQKMEAAQKKSGSVSGMVPLSDSQTQSSETTVTVRKTEQQVQPQAQKVQRKIYAPQFDIRPLIARSTGTNLKAITQVGAQSDEQKAVYQWESNQIYGSVEQSPLQNSQDFEPRIQAYLEKTQSRCDGEFAIMPDDSRQQGPSRVDSYDIACIGKDVSSSASLLFVKKDNTFSVVAHEAAPENMETAMSLREKLISLMMGS